MSPQQIKFRLELIKKSVTSLGLEVVNQKEAIKIDDMQKLLKPFANLENAFEREIRKFSTQNKTNG